MKPSKRFNRALLVAAIVVSLSLLWLVMRWQFSSVVCSVRIENAYNGDIEVAYRGASWLERGTVKLGQGERRRIVLYRGDGRPPPDAQFFLSIRHQGLEQEHAFPLQKAVDPVDMSGELGFPIVVVRPDGTEIEYTHGSSAASAAARD